MAHRRIGIRTKLLAGFGFVIAVTIIVALLGVTKLRSLDDRTTVVGDIDLPSAQVIGDINGAESDYRSGQLQHVVATDPAEMKTWEQELAKRGAAVQAAFRRYAPLITNARDQTLYDQARRGWQQYLQVTAPFVARSRANDQPAALTYVNDRGRPVFDAVSAQLGRWSGYNRSLAAADVQASHSTYASARTLLLVLAAIAVLVSAALALLLSRSIVRAVRGVLDRLEQLRREDIAGLRGAMTAMAEGNLTVHVEPTTPAIERWPNDELGDVAQAVNLVRDDTTASIEAYNASRDALAGLIGQVTTTSGTLSAASQEMASTSEEAGRAVGEIANAVGDVAAGAERQVRMVDATRVAAEDTATAAGEARRVAQEGAGAAERATGAMTQVRDSSARVTEAIRSLSAKSDEIGGIVATIGGIAEQTNLLALNAAIEAAGRRPGPRLRGRRRGGAQAGRGVPDGRRHDRRADRADPGRDRHDGGDRRGRRDPLGGGRGGRRAGACRVRADHRRGAGRHRPHRGDRHLDQRGRLGGRAVVGLHRGGVGLDRGDERLHAADRGLGPGLARTAEHLTELVGRFQLA